MSRSWSSRKKARCPCGHVLPSVSGCRLRPCPKPSIAWSTTVTPNLRQDRSIQLTDQGRELATTVVRRHRLAERLLLDVIGLEWEKVHHEADRWEHVISAEVEEKLVQLLGDPATCPHGNPIPGARTEMKVVPTTALSEAAPGEMRVARISEKLELSDEGLHFVAVARLVPGAAVTVIGRRPDGIAVRTSVGEHIVPLEVAEQLYISDTN